MFFGLAIGDTKVVQTRHRDYLNGLTHRIKIQNIDKLLEMDYCGTPNKKETNKSIFVIYIKARISVCVFPFSIWTNMPTLILQFYGSILT